MVKIIPKGIVVKISITPVDGFLRLGLYKRGFQHCYNHFSSTRSLF